MILVGQSALSIHDFSELIFKHKGFIRIHKTHLINLNFIDQYIRKEGGSVLMKDGSLLPVAVRKKEILLSELGKF